MTDLPVILFPHSHISGTDLRKLFPFFGQVTICQPWFMDAPAQSAEKGDFPSIHVLNPPESLKPKKDFKRLLSEYQLWVKQNQDKGYAASLSFSRETAQSEETPWEIRQMIQRIGKNLSGPDEHKAFKWHLLIHLAREFEESQAEADELLDRVKHQKPPLEEALEERSVLKNLFEDLPRFEKYFSTHEHHLALVFEAWLGLFGQYLSDYRLLVTFDRHVMGYVTDPTHLSEVQFNLPDLSNLPVKDLQGAKDQYCNGSFGKAFRALVKAMERQAGPHSDELQGLAKKVGESFSSEPSSSRISVTLKAFRRPVNREEFKGASLITALFGKIVILLEE